ncbi:hypothetical protein [Nocardioides flavescens]|uniref:Uncharacterized protein n=1 Tax=Nocardioides flavescens TaxID=2691959 RepID=A0A6L7F115_9ACTN|nr:hypothetical protein [Nocardioides flavescens]MXG89942.1 hypothetical protein [Nocardioides flavescens]
MTLLIVLSVLAGWCVLSVPVALVAARLLHTRHAHDAAAPAPSALMPREHHAA